MCSHNIEGPRANVQKEDEIVRIGNKEVIVGMHTIEEVVDAILQHDESGIDVLFRTQKTVMLPAASGTAGMLEKKLTLTKNLRTKTKWIPYWFDLDKTTTIMYYNRQEDYRAKQPIGTFVVDRVASNPDGSLTIHYQESASENLTADESGTGQFTIRNVSDATSADGTPLFNTLTGMVTSNEA